MKERYQHHVPEYMPFRVITRRHITTPNITDHIMMRLVGLILAWIGACAMAAMFLIALLISVNPDAALDIAQMIR